MYSYEKIRQQHRPQHIKTLLIAESPPPSAETQSSRHFYRSEKIRSGDRLFTNTIRALYPETITLTERQLEEEKEHWLQKFQTDGWFMIEALEGSLQHHVTKQERQEAIHAHLPRLLERVRALATHDTKIILIKSNVFEVAAEPFRRAGYNVLNTELVDYPGRFNQQAYRRKLAALTKA